MRKINIVRIHNNVGAYENGKLLGYTYGLTNTMILDVLGINFEECEIKYREFFPSEDVDNSYPKLEKDINF